MVAGSRKKQLTRIAGVAILVALVLPLSSNAQQSRLEQEIIAPDCTQPGQCDLRPPIIQVISKNGGRPIFTGVYDVVYTDTLRVIFGGVTYQLGEDEELTARNSYWQLDLSRLLSSVSPGGYTVVVEAIGRDGSIERTTATVVFMQSDLEPLPPQGGDRPSPGSEENPSTPEPAPRPVPEVPYERITEVRDIGAVVALVVTSVGLLLLVLAIRRLRPRQQQ